MMMGGQEEPCLPPEQLAVIESTKGRGCPRVDLDAGNAGMDCIAFALLDKQIRPLALPLFEAVTDGLGPEKRKAIILRLQAVLSDPEVVEMTYPAAANEAQAEQLLGLPGSD